MVLVGIAVGERFKAMLLALPKKRPGNICYTRGGVPYKKEP